MIEAKLRLIKTKSVNYVSNQTEVNNLEIKIFELQKELEKLQKGLITNNYFNVSVEQLKFANKLEKNTKFHAILNERPVVFEGFQSQTKTKTQNLGFDLNFSNVQNDFNTIKSNLNNEELAVLPIKSSNSKVAYTYKVLVNNKCLTVYGNKNTV